MQLIEFINGKPIPKVKCDRLINQTCLWIYSYHPNQFQNEKGQFDFTVPLSHIQWIEFKFGNFIIIKQAYPKWKATRLRLQRLCARGHRQCPAIANWPQPYIQKARAWAASGSSIAAPYHCDPSAQTGYSPTRKLHSSSECSLVGFDLIVHLCPFSCIACPWERLLLLATNVWYGKEWNQKLSKF